MNKPALNPQMPCSQPKQYKADHISRDFAVALRSQ